MDVPLADAPLPAPVPYLGNIFGPYLIGACVNSLFYGVLALQVLIYFMYYKQDRKWIKCFVLYLFFVETVNLGCNIATIYDPLVTHYGSVRSIILWPIMIVSTPPTTAAISIPVQVFTAWRIVVLTQKKWIGATIVMLSLLSLGGAIWTAAVLAINKTYLKAFTIAKPVTFWYSSSLLVDVVVTAALYLSLSTRKTGFNSTDLMVNKIIKLTLQTGLITLVLAAADLILFVVFSGNTTNLAVLFPLSKLYSNALLSTLNSRLSWRSLGDVESRRAEDDNLLFGNREQTNTPHPTLRSRTTRDPGYNHSADGYQLRAGVGKISNVNRTNTSLYAIPTQDSSHEEDVLPIALSKNFATDSIGNLSSS